MSWRAYQDSLHSTDRPKRRKIRSRRPWRPIAVRGVIVFSVLTGLLAGAWGVDRSWSWIQDQRQTETDSQQTEKIDPQAQAREKLKEGLKGVLISEMGSDVDVAIAKDEVWQAELTLDLDLQGFIQRLLERNRVDWAGVAVIDAETGAVLSLASHSEKEPTRQGLSLKAPFPAASIFKVVTAAAALQEGKLKRDSAISFNGNSSRIVKRELKRASGRYRMSVERAFAKSSNLIFGKIGVQKLSSELLQRYAVDFGFNEAIPFDAQLAMSDAEIPTEGLVEQARTAAGFGKVHLSPLHGAMIAGAIASDGKMMKPFVVGHALNLDGEKVYETTPELWKRPIKADVAAEMRRMMYATISRGTARKWFRNFRRHPILENLDMGGKTGSLSGRDPWGKHEWFVGYARSRDRQIAVGVVTVSEKYWRIKPAKIAREIFEFQFAPKPIVKATATRKKENGKNGGS